MHYRFALSFYKQFNKGLLPSLKASVLYLQKHSTYLYEICYLCPTHPIKQKAMKERTQEAVTIEAAQILAAVERATAKAVEKAFTILNKPVLSFTEAVAYTRVSRSRLYSLTSGKKIPYYKTGTRVYFKRADLDAFLTSTRVGTHEEAGAAANDYTNRKVAAL